MAKRIALFLLNAATDYQAYVGSTARTAAAKCGFELEIMHSSDGEQERPIRHITQIFESLRRPPGSVPDAILIQPMNEQCPSVVEAAGRARVGCAVMNRKPDFLPEMRRKYPDIPIFSVAPDNGAIGRIQGEQFRTLLPGGGRLLYVQGIEVATATQERRRAMVASIAGAGIDVVPLYGDWMGLQSENEVWKWLNRLAPSDKFPDLIGCQNDEMAEGAHRALQRYSAARRDPSLADRPVTGCDGTPSHGLRLVQERILVATITRGSASAVAIEALADYFKRGMSPPPYVDMPVESFPPIDTLKKRASRFMG